MVYKQSIKLFCFLLSLGFATTTLAFSPGAYHGGMDGGNSGASSAGNSGSTSGFNDNGMGRDVRTESSISYLLSTYGSNTDNWPCDTTTNVGVPVSQINVGDPPSNHSYHRASKYMRDRK